MECKNICVSKNALNVLNAFSFVEIILVIAIVGILAMIVFAPFKTFPERQQYIVKLKQSYGEFNTALVKLTADSGCLGNLKCTGLVAAGTTDKVLGEAIIKYFRVAKDCSTMTDLGCMSSKVSTRYDGTTIRSDYDKSSYRFMTANGSVFSISNYGNNCSVNSSRINDLMTTPGNSGCSNDKNGDANGNGSGKNNGVDKNGSGNGNNSNANKSTTCIPAGTISVDTSMTQVCGSVYIDVNGALQGPNNFGRDIFAFWLTNGKGVTLYPMGGEDDDEIGWWKNPTTSTPKYCYPGQADGTWCTGRVMEESWQMRY